MGRTSRAGHARDMFRPLSESGVLMLFNDMMAVDRGWVSGPVDAEHAAGPRDRGAARLRAALNALLPPLSRRGAVTNQSGVRGHRRRTGPFVVAPLIERSYTVFTSPLGTWIPFAAICCQASLSAMPADKGKRGVREASSLKRQEHIMPTIEAVIKRHSVLIYFALVFVISWGGGFLLLGPGGFPPSGEEFESLGALFYIASEFERATCLGRRHTAIFHSVDRNWERRPRTA